MKKTFAVFLAFFYAFLFVAEFGNSSPVKVTVYNATTDRADHIQQSADRASSCWHCPLQLSDESGIDQNAPAAVWTCDFIPLLDSAKAERLRLPEPDRTETVPAGRTMSSRYCTPIYIQKQSFLI